ncbi:hypothetical protein BTVI_93221 [Pitangus sulphuratus]|nr:hypothetical protein BTVI_93221 [Pitangus sulphuratus]
MSCQFLQENDVGNTVKGFVEVQRSPELDAVPQVRSYQSGVEEQSHLNHPAFESAQVMVGFLDCERTLMSSFSSTGTPSQQGCSSSVHPPVCIDTRGSPDPGLGIPSRLELCQVWCCDHFPGEPVLVPNHPLGEEPFSNIQLKPLLTQLQAVPLGPVTGHHREEISAYPASSPPEEIVDCNEVSPQSPPG